MICITLSLVFNDRDGKSHYHTCSETRPPATTILIEGAVVINTVSEGIAKYVVILCSPHCLSNLIEPFSKVRTYLFELHWLHLKLHFASVNQRILASHDETDNT
jgi:hypothetical protein